MFQSPIPPDFLRDESRKTGTAEGIAFPRDTAELSAALRLARARGQAVTVQGARTGIAAGAVPEGGVIVSLARMDRLLGFAEGPDGQPLLRVQPGTPLTTVRRHLAGHLPADGAPRLFTPDPTETTASLGGMAACNASGACSFAYGPTRRHIAALTVALADGDTLTLRRGGAHAHGLAFTLTTDSGRTLAGALPQLAAPAVKNAAGYWVRPDMDLLDLFIGSEGTLGVIAELDLRLLPRPASTLGVIAFLPGEPETLAAVTALRARRATSDTHTLTALEYFDPGALRLIRSSAPAAGLPLPPAKPHWRHALYTEWALAADGDAPGPDALLRATLRDAGGDPDDTWVAATPRALERLKAFRHAAPEQVNALIAERKRHHPSLTKLGTDLSVPDDRLADVLALYREGLARTGLEHVIFGHIGDNHLHVNILPRDPADYETGKALTREWAAQAVAWGGSISAEHGVGRLKRELLALQYGPAGIDGMRRLKSLFDPDGRLNPGRLF